MKLKDVAVTFEHLSKLGFEDYCELEQEVTRIREDLNGELALNPSICSHFKTLMNTAKERLEKAELHFDITCAKLKNEIHTELGKTGTRAVKDLVESKLFMTGEYKLGRLQVIKSDLIYCNLKGLLQALTKK